MSFNTIWIQGIGGSPKGNDSHFDHKIHKHNTVHSIGPTSINTNKSILKTCSLCHEKDKHKKIVKNCSNEHSNPSFYKEGTLQTGIIVLRLFNRQVYQNKNLIHHNMLVHRIQQVISFSSLWMGIWWMSE